MSECTHMVTDNRIGPNFGRPLVHRECSKQLAAAEATIAELTAALQFYAEIREYHPVAGDPAGVHAEPPILWDKGQRARAALSRQPAGGVGKP